MNGEQLIPAEDVAQVCKRKHSKPFNPRNGPQTAVEDEFRLPAVARAVLEAEVLCPEYGAFATAATRHGGLVDTADRVRRRRLVAGPRDFVLDGVRPVDDGLRRRRDGPDHLSHAVVDAEARFRLGVEGEERGVVWERPDALLQRGPDRGGFVGVLKADVVI